MKKKYPPYFILSCLFLFGLSASLARLQAQSCVNADFSDGNFTGWTGTYSIDQCTQTGMNGRCSCSPTNPYNTTGFNQGPNNSPANDATNEWSQIITTSAGGNDPLIAGFGYTLPMVWPGNANSARIGNMWQNVSNTKTGDGESISYSFVVTAANCNFTYHYAVVLYNGNHSPGQQAYFNISMVAANSNTIPCAAYEVDATTAATIGGFSDNDSIFWKPWSSVAVPLYDYIGQTVTITFTTRGCIPNGCAGKHFAYAYISAECAPLNLSLSNTGTVDCGQLDTLTAPTGSAAYSWSGPGIVGSSTKQSVVINQPGLYSVTLTTFGNTPCSFTIDTVIAGNVPHPEFSVPLACEGSPVTFTDQSTSPTPISSRLWNFGDGDTSTAQNPGHTFDSAGTYAVKLTVTSSVCIEDTTVDITVLPLPTSTFTVVSPVCEGTNSNIVYTGNGTAGFTYTWDFDGGTGIPDTGRGSFNISWQVPGTKNVTLTVSAGSCISPPDTQQVLVKPYPGMTLTPYTTICAGSSAMLTAANATTYTWSPSPSLNATDTSTVIATPVTTTTYSVTGSNTNCISVDTVTVGVNRVPTPTFTANGPVCIGQNSTVTYTGDAAASATYNWSFDGGDANPGTGQGPIQVNWLAPGTYDITLTVSQSGCDSTRMDTVNVYSTPPQPALGYDTVTGCPNLEVCLTSAPVDGTVSYIWNFGDGGASEIQNPCHFYLIPGVYSVSFQVELSPECVYDTTLTDLVTIVADPVAAFTPSATVIQQPQSLISFTNQSTNALDYLWDFVLTGVSNEIAGTSADTSPQFNFMQYGQYNVILYAYNQLGCPDSALQAVTVLPEQNFFIPNAFTPNGDGVDDNFYICAQPGAVPASFLVFDRWGEKVHDGTYPWDGTYNGKNAPSGVYVYLFTIHLVDMQTDIERTGTVTLIR